jgi:hypothetical protein
MNMPDDFGRVIGFTILILFVPFLVSLLGTMIFKVGAFVCSCAALVAAAMSATSGRLQIWVFWLAAWVFAAVGIWRKYRNRRATLAPNQKPVSDVFV